MAEGRSQGGDAASVGVVGVEANESTPLLIGSASASASSKARTGTGRAAGGTRSSSARGQILLLCYARFIEPLAFFSIFPYINPMLVANGSVAASDVGFYSGLIESLFSLTQMSVMLVWGRLADRVGRKGVLVASLAGVSAGASVFGLARRVWQMMAFRCVTGLFAGTVLTVRTMISENCRRATQARAFAAFAFAGNMGILIGPLVGGALAEPAKQYGGLLARSRFLVLYPYALPGFAVGLIGLSAVLLTALFLDETLPGPGKMVAADDRQPDGSAEVRRDAAGAASTQPTQPTQPAGGGPISTWELLQWPGVGMVLYIYGHVIFLAIAFTALLPVLLYTPVALGGLGMSPLQISITMGITGFAQAVWLLLVFPPLQQRMGSKGVMRWCGYAYPFAVALPPLLNAMLRRGWLPLVWAVAPVALLMAPGVSMSFTAVQLVLNDVSPGPASLGTLNALALTVTSGLRGFGPAAFTTLFAVGVRGQILAGYLAWLVLVLIAAGFTVVVHWLPEASEMDVSEDEREDDGEVEGG